MCLFNAVSDGGKHDKRTKADKDDKKEKVKSSQVNFGAGLTVKFMSLCWRVHCSSANRTGVGKLWPLNHIPPVDALLPTHCGFLNLCSKQLMNYILDVCVIYKCNT